MQHLKTRFIIFVLVILLTLSLFYIERSRPSTENGVVYVHFTQVTSMQTENETTDNPQEKHPGSENEDYILHPPNLCMQSSSRAQLDYLVLIYSAPGNFDQRSAIRETWASELRQRSNSRIAFLLAKTQDANLQRAIESESYLHSDIIQGTYIDHYHNQTLKAKMMVRWAQQYCPNVSFVCKSDDDSYVNVPMFLNVMKNKRTDAIHGSLFVNARPHRNTDSKWYVSRKHYNGTDYPLFVAGAFYILGGSIVHRLHEALDQVPFFWLEDVYLNGFVAQKAGVDRINDNAFPTYPMTSVCGVLKTATSHYITPKNMRLYWYKLHHSRIEC